MKTLKKETKSLIDISLLDNEFFVAMLNQILAQKNRCKMDYPKTKIYFDGSHYIVIPHTT